MDADFLQKSKLARANIEKLQESFKAKFKVKADEMSDMGGEGESKCCCEHCGEKDTYLYYMVEAMSSYLSYIESSFYRYTQQHSQGHLPPINGAGQMENALKKLGMDSDYNVAKPTVFASTRKGSIVNLS